ncbi:saccharopine dehydrogenase-like oxidoreductase [Toxorhynchites rutilus septentrionalis]|uniref:saccharopine dehydrogenase-like oxidoreductase n=1 Tax=Toxorhynchites rutilus septentrionalis TaxID=329112 RepID=UPI002479284A|nr:saccharopine dehydrogenase-like oxidoreductase [Toxorhynchites rutilus septentrionalis]
MDQNKFPCHIESSSHRDRALAPFSSQVRVNLLFPVVFYFFAEYSLQQVENQLTMSLMRKLDVIIFGASGFTGKYTVYEGVKLLANTSWAIAGRTKSKLEAVLVEMGRKSGTDLSHIPIVLADVDDQQSLVRMAQQCKIVVNCCGPYRLFGEQMIKACLEAGTHHVDVSGEQQFLEGMQLKYHEAAKQKGIYLVSACGFESIPADMGTLFVEREFDGGVVNSVECYVCTRMKRKSLLGAIHYGTWASAVHMIANMKEVGQIRRELFKVKLPELFPRLKERPAIHKSSGNKWSLPLVGPDRSCVLRTQRFLYETERKRPVQMRTYISFGGVAEALVVSFVAIVFWLLVKTTFGQQLLLKYPRVFSLGLVSHQGPSDEAMNNTHFSMYFEGRGWEENLSDPFDKYVYPPNKIVRTKVTGTNPGYGATCVALLLSARTILKETAKLPGNGGYLTPGAAFAKTNLIAELCDNGFTFEVLSKSKIERSNE